MVRICRLFMREFNYLGYVEGSMEVCFAGPFLLVPWDNFLGPINRQYCPLRFTYCGSMGHLGFVKDVH